MSSAAWAIPAAQPAKAPPREAVANAGVTAPPPMKEAEIESQPIVRNRNKATADAAPGQKPSGLGLPRVAAALAGVIGLILLLRWAGGKLSRQPGVGRASSAVQVLVRAPVSGRQQVLLLKVGKRILVVGDSGSQMNPLSEITDADEVATLIGMLGGDKSDFASKTFDKVFRRARREMDSDDDDGRLAIAPEPPEDMPDPADAETAIDPRMLDTRGQIDGLARRVRAFSEQFAETKRRESL
ncbi:MAG TPA: flagellar biosynthetic protein FliO [Tepidisphaeraceae bacterium]|nr:flagellar biosynthetic protein FliO [Tepidisphaeraceae bacterium]